jgi:competence protein ComEC
VISGSQILLAFCLSFLAGVFAGSFSENLFLSSTLAFLAAFFIFTLLRRFFLTVLIFGFFCFGFFWFFFFKDKLLNNDLAYFVGREVILEGKIIQDPKPRENYLELVINPFFIKTEDFEAKETKIENSPKVLVKVNKYLDLAYGDFLKIKGVLKEPQNFEGFNYQEYLLSKGIRAQIDFPKIEKISQQGNSLFSIIFAFKRKALENIESYFSPPKNYLFSALIFGEDGQMPKILKEKLNLSGLRHISAVSGANISVLIFIFLEIFLFLGFWRFQASILAFFLIVLYVLMIGAPLSAVRAAIMAGFALFAQLLGRFSAPFRGLIFAAFLITLFNPLVLRYDVGFQLSFLATLGIIELTPFFEKWLLFGKDSENFLFVFLKKNLSVILASQVFTLPLLLYNFGFFSLVSVFSNLLLAPLLPFLMMAGIVLLIFSFLLPLFAFLLSLLLFPFFVYFEALIDFFSGLSWSALWFKISSFGLFFFYLILFFFLFWLKKRYRESLPY